MPKSSPPPSARQGADIEWLRCSGERTALFMCIASNIIVVALAWLVILAGSDWLDTHPFVAGHRNSMRALELTGVIALPVLPFSRRLKLHAARNSGIRVGEAQFPELYEQLLRACSLLNIKRVPDLYVSRRVDGPSVAYSTVGGESIVVLNADLVPTDWKEGLDWLSFAVASALGSLCLGHTRWWVELLTGYAGRTPGLQTPLLLKRTYSRDRCAAFVVPEGIQGLVVEAVGKDAVVNVSIAAFIEQSKSPPSVWDTFGAFQLRTPPVAARATALYEAGLFDRTRDVERLDAPRAAEKGTERSRAT